MSSIRGIRRTQGLDYIAEGLIQAHTDPERASRALATKIAIFRPSREELHERGVDDRLLQRGLEQIRLRGRIPRQPALKVKFMGAKSLLLQNLPNEPTRRRPHRGRAPGAIPRSALR